MTVRHDIRLADGRELFYYDSADSADNADSADSAGRTPYDAPDRRSDLPPTETSSEVRWNPLLRDYAVIAGHRQSRTYRPPATLCPLCPTRGETRTEVPAPDYEVAVFENRFPAFALKAAASVPLVDMPPFRSGPGDGRCEVVCFSSRHDDSFANLPVDRVRTVIDAWADRTSALAAIDSVDYVFCFENRGEEIGVTLSHPHGQIYGYPFVPPRFFALGHALRRHRERTGECLQCSLLAAELEDGSRVVVESAHWVAYVPFAARWPYEVRVVPREHVADLPGLDDATRDDLAGLYLDVLARFDRLFDTPSPYIAGWQQAPVRQDRDDWHLAAEVFTTRRAPGLLKFLAGSESGAGVWVNDVAPEDAAQRLRETVRSR